MNKELRSMIGRIKNKDLSLIKINIKIYGWMNKKYLL